MCKCSGYGSWQWGTVSLSLFLCTVQVSLSVLGCAHDYSGCLQAEELEYRRPDGGLAYAAAIDAFAAKKSNPEQVR